MSEQRGRDWLVSVVVLLLCGAILALFTDLETRTLRRLNPDATPSVDRSR